MTYLPPPQRTTIILKFDVDTFCNPLHIDRAMTQLPDGSAFFTADIMSKEEALTLPLKERPLNYRISGDMYHAVFEAIGAASMCWNPKPRAAVFDSEAASKIAVDLCFKIANELESKVP